MGIQIPCEQNIWRHVNVCNIHKNENCKVGDLFFFVINNSRRIGRHAMEVLVTFPGGVGVPGNEVVSAERILVGLEASSVVPDDAGLLDVLHEPRVFVRLAHHVQVRVISCPDKYCNYLDLWYIYTVEHRDGHTETEKDIDTDTNKLTQHSIGISVDVCPCAV